MGTFSPYGIYVELGLVMPLRIDIISVSMHYEVHEESPKLIHSPLLHLDGAFW